MKEVYKAKISANLARWIFLEIPPWTRCPETESAPVEDNLGLQN